ncbi:MAG: hypothetical protein OXC07_02175 [Kistimonas sp.]|nr:hypothetical protein [Kistimonas sp.]
MTAPRLAPLEHEQLLHFAGEDSQRFLQGQLTCDMRILADGEHLLGACCTPQGRMLANFRLLSHAAGFTLAMPAGQPVFLKQQLQKYAIFFRQMSMQDISTQWMRLGLFGPAAESVLAALMGTPCPPQGQSLSWEQGHVLALPGTEARFEIWLPPQSPAAAALQAETIAVPPESWQLADIEAGIGWVTENTRAMWIPQELEWHQRGGVSFTKGCYTGQEIVARLAYRGTLKSRLYRFSSTDTSLPVPGTELLTAEGKKSGLLVGAARSPSQRLQLLAVVRSKDADGPLLLNGQPLTREPLASVT